MCFPQNVANSKSGTEMVMENQEKSCQNIFFEVCGNPDIVLRRGVTILDIFVLCPYLRWRTSLSLCICVCGTAHCLRRLCEVVITSCFNKHISTRTSNRFIFFVCFMHDAYVVPSARYDREMIRKYLSEKTAVLIFFFRNNVRFQRFCQNTVI